VLLVHETDFWGGTSFLYDSFVLGVDRVDRFFCTLGDPATVFAIGRALPTQHLFLLEPALGTAMDR
jgi:hypothetical protein